MERAIGKIGECNFNHIHVIINKSGMLKILQWNNHKYWVTYKMSNQCCVSTMKVKGCGVCNQGTIMVFNVVCHNYHCEYRPRDNT
jgi:hypothetical protein